MSILRSISFRSALTALLLAPVAWESALGEDGTEMSRLNKPAKSPNP
jgi:hypothetical protein